MKIDNFKLIEVIGDGPLNWKFRATVDIHNGMWFWKKKKTRAIFRKFAQNWIYSDTGKPCEYVVFNLEKALESRTGKNIEECGGEN